MLMRDQHLYKSPADVYGHCRLLLPWLRVPCWFFLQSGVEKLLAWVAGDWTHNHTLDLSSQSGAYDLSATATPWIEDMTILILLDSINFFYFLKLKSFQNKKALKHLSFCCFGKTVQSNALIEIRFPRLPELECFTNLEKYLNRPNILRAVLFNFAPPPFFPSEDHSKLIFKISVVSN